MEEGMMSDPMAAIFCLGLFITMTVGQWLLGRLLSRDKRLVAPSRTWMLVCIPVVSVVYYVITDGLSTLQLEFVKYILIWAIAMSVLHIVANEFDSFLIKWKDKEVQFGRRMKDGRRMTDKEIVVGEE